MRYEPGKSLGKRWSDWEVRDWLRREAGRLRALGRDPDYHRAPRRFVPVEIPFQSDYDRGWDDGHASALDALSGGLTEPGEPS